MLGGDHRIGRRVREVICDVYGSGFGVGTRDELPSGVPQPESFRIRKQGFVGGFTTHPPWASWEMPD